MTSFQAAGNQDASPNWRKSLASTANGAAVGAGCGFLMCDFIDLRGGDISAFKSWLGATFVGVTVGAAVGFWRRVRPLARFEPRLPSAIVRRRFQILGAVILSEGLLVGGTLPRDMPGGIFTVSMVVAGIVYLAVGFVIARRSSPSP